MVSLKNSYKILFFWCTLASIFTLHYILAHSTPALLDNYPTSLEWPLLIDILITIPLLYYFLFKPTIKTLLLKSTVFFTLGIFIGSYIIPSDDQFIWPYLTQARYVIIAAFVIVEVSLLVSLFHIIFKGSSGNNLEQSLGDFLSRKVRSTALVELYMFETRVWLYALFSRKQAFNLVDSKTFSYHSHNGNASNQQGFIFIILFELPIVHFILHLAWSPTVAYWVSGLTLYGLIFMYADYKATLLRPISLNHDRLTIRYGVWGHQEIPLSHIAQVCSNTDPVKRSKNHLRFCQFGAPNVRITFKPSKGVRTPFSSQAKETVYIGLDNPAEFIQSLREECCTNYS